MAIEVNPGVGDPSEIRRLAVERSGRAGEIRLAGVTLDGAVRQASGGSWRGAARDAFVSTLSGVVPDVRLLAEGLEKQAVVLHQYAAAVQSIKDEQRVLEYHRREAVETVRRFTGRLVEFEQRLGWLESGHDAGKSGLAEDLRRDRARLAARVRSEEAALGRLEAAWRELVERRHTADRVAVAGLRGEAVLGAGWRLSAAAIAGSTPAALLAMLVGLSATDLKVLSATHPELADRLARADPTMVASWWDGLADGPDPSATQLALITGLPTVIGALNGLPPMVRVQANRLNATERLRRADEELTVLTPAAQEATRVASAHLEKVFGDLRRHLEAETAYLRKVIAGEVNLYLYDHDTARIIEMIGTPADTTAHVITYVPGTYTDLNSFHNGGVQQVGQFLHDSIADTVVFVYKDGRFPGQADKSLLGLLEANEAELARASGATLAAHLAGVSAVPHLSSASTTAIGHSWGLANITSSEVAGARYDNVVSLSGAWMPDDWTPNENTRYVDYSYDDVLQGLQRLGLVGDGSNPRAHEAFTFDDYYRAPGDLFVPALDGERHQNNPWNLLADHNLIATDDDSNRRLLRRLVRDLGGFSR